MLNKNKEIFEFTGVNRFHMAGYTGSRVRVATGERLSPEDWPGPGKAGTLVDDGRKTTDSHCRMTSGVFFEVAPDATLYRASNDTCKDGFMLYDVLMPKMEQLGICLMFTSQSSSGIGANEYTRAEEFYKTNDWFVPFWAAGNGGESSANGKLNIPCTVGVAAYAVVDRTAIPKNYSSVSDEVDFAAPTDVWYQCSDMDEPRLGTGTSAATPCLCGMAALVQDFFIDKTGQPLKRNALLRFFRDNCVDLETPGHDSKTGCGAVVLPDPDTIDVWAYQEGGPEEMKVEDFKDYNQISEWAKDGIQKCLDVGIMDGVGNGMFNPKGPVTREQMATIAARLMEVMA